MRNNEIDDLWARKETRRARKESRLEPFVELNEKNTNLHDRFKAIIGLSGSETISPPIVLKRPTKEDQDTLVIGFVFLVTKKDYDKDYNTHLPVSELIEIEIFTVSHKELERIKDIGIEQQEKLYYDDTSMKDVVGHKANKNKVIDDNFVDDLRLSLKDDEPDAIIKGGENNVSSRKIEVVKLIKRALYKKIVEKVISNREETIEMFERAIGDPKLNPEFAGSLHATLADIYDLPEITK